MQYPASLRTSVLDGDVVPARHVADPFHLPRRAHDLLEVGEVLDLDQHRTVRLPVDRLELHRANVGAGGADGGGDVGIEAASVVPLELEADEESLPFPLLPLDLEPALRLVLEEQQVGAVRAVDAHAAPTRHVARHAVPGNGLAALGVADHEPVNALDAHAAGDAPDAIDQTLDDVRLRRLLVRGVDVRKERLEHARDIDVPLPQRGVEV